MSQHPWPAQSGAIQYISPPPSEEWIKTKRKIVLLGSTGSIGVNTLKVFQTQPHLFEVIALAGAFNIQLLAKQALEFYPPYLAVYNIAGVELLRKLLPKSYRPTILHGQEGYETLARLDEANTIVSAQVGAAGLRGTVAAALAGKVIGLANKESLVLAGSLIRHICKKTQSVILPIDSEHNALFQMLAGRKENHIKKLILTASGGPFRTLSREELEHVSCEQALAHPNWNMGAKISIDSASLMNKGLELIEAYHLYGLKAEQLDVAVHPQSIVHSLVEFQDNSLMAHLGSPDMRMPIGHCLAWPHCLDVGVQPLDLFSLKQGLTFTKADTLAFPCLDLAKQALNLGQDRCIVLNAANEIAVEFFLQKRIAFLDIPKLIKKAMNWYEEQNISNNQEIWQNMNDVPSIMQHIIALDMNTREFLAS